MVQTSPLVIFLLIFARVTAAIVVAPIFSERAIPIQVKVGISAITAFILTPGQLQGADAVRPDPLTFAFFIGQQILLGLAFALVFVVIYRAAEMAGELIGQQLGVSLGSFVVSGQGEMHTVAELYHLVAGLLFLGLDAHQWVILGLGASFNALPVSRVALSPSLVGVLLPLGGAALQFALGLALPLLAVLLLADIITGLLGRAIPSLNLFVLGLPLKVLLGLAGLLLAAPFTIHVFIQIMQTIPHLRMWQ